MEKKDAIQTKFTSTNNESVCRGCGVRFVVSVEAIKWTMDECGYTKEEAADSIDFCEDCAGIDEDYWETV